MAYMSLVGVANSKTLEMACFEQTSKTFQTVLRSWSVEDDRNNVIKLLKIVDKLKIKDVSILLREELMKKKSECGCQKCIDFSYKECLQHQLKFFDMDPNIWHEIYAKILGNNTFDMSHERLSEIMNVTTVNMSKFETSYDLLETFMRCWSAEDDKNNVIKLLKIVDDLKIEDISVLLRRELMKKKAQCDCQKCIDFSYKEMQWLPFEKKSQDLSDSDKPDIYECLQKQLNFFEMDGDTCQEVCSKMLDSYKVEIKHMRLGEKMNTTIEDIMNSQTTYNSFETFIRCWMDICDCGEFPNEEPQMEPSINSEEKVEYCSDDEHSKINELQMEPSIYSERKVKHCSDDEDSKINGNNDVRKAYVNLAGVVDSETLEIALLEHSPNPFQTVLRHWSGEDVMNNVIKLFKMMDDLKIKDVSILLREELMKKGSECGCQKCIDFFHHKDCLQEQLKFFDMNPNICNQICTKIVGNIKFEMTLERIAVIMNLTTENMRKFKTPYDLLETFMRCWSAEDDKNNVIKLLKIVDDLKIEDISVLLRRELMKKKAQCDCEKCIDFFYKEGQSLPFKKKSQDFNGSDNLDIYECMREQLRFFEMDEDICQDVCSKLLDNNKVETKHVRLGERMNLTIKDMMNSQTTYNSFETLIRCWMDICDCGEFSNEELQMQPSINSEEKVEYCGDDEDSEINEMQMEPSINSEEKFEYWGDDEDSEINDKRCIHFESLEMALLEHSPNPFQTFLRHWSAEDGKNNVIKLLKMMDDLKIKDVSILLREELMKKWSECGCQICIDFFHYNDCLQEQLKFFDMNPNICNQICTKIVGNIKFEMTHERIAEIMNLTTENMRKFTTSYNLLETFMRCWSAEDDKNNVIKLLKIVDYLKIEDISVLLRHELMKKKAQCDCQKCIDFSYEEGQLLPFEKKSQDFNGSDNLDIYECKQEQLRFFEMDKDICQEVCSKMLDNNKVEMKHMRLGEKMNITIEDMMNSQTIYNSFETLIRFWMDICDCGEFSNEAILSGKEKKRCFQADLSYTKLTTEEIEKIGPKVGTNWNILGALLEIPFDIRDEITVFHTIYPNLSAKAKEILVIFNEGKKFDRYVLKKCLEEINLDLDEILSPTNQFDGESEAFERIQSFSSFNKVDLRFTKLTTEEMEKISEKVATDWNKLGGLLEIPFEQRDGISVNHNSFPSPSAKARKILKIFNERTDFDRHLLKKYLGEIYLDLDEILAPTKETSRNEDVLTTREIYQLSCHIASFWDGMAAMMNMESYEVDNVRYNTNYENQQIKAEKILSILSNKWKTEFRSKLVETLQSMNKRDLADSILNYEWKHLH